MTDENPLNTGDQSPPNEGVKQEECDAVRSIRVQFPSMMQNNIELWFIQLDHWFSANGVKSDELKFSSTVATLNGALLQQVYDHVVRPPATGKYKALKAAITANFSDLRRVGGDNQDETLLRGLWLQRLPIQVRTCLSTVGIDQPLSKLAEIADTVMETFRVGESNEIYDVRANTQRPSTNAANSDLREEMRELTKLVKQLATSQGRGRSASRSNIRPPRSSTPANDESGECWYHSKYKEEATKCRKPCRWHTKN